MKLHIRYMVSKRCKQVVKNELQKIGVKTDYILVDFGTVEISENITERQKSQLEKSLSQAGLELLDDKRSMLIERINSVISEMIYYPKEDLKINYSEYLSQTLGYDYTYLSNIFSEVKGITIQQFIIFHKIELVKELLIYDELNLSEISYKLNYSSVAHLSAQFKKVTGLTPSYFKEIKLKRLGNLAHIEN